MSRWIKGLPFPTLSQAHLDSMKLSSPSKSLTELANTNKNLAYIKLSHIPIVLSPQQITFSLNSYMVS